MPEETKTPEERNAQENLSLAQWAASQDASIEELKILVSAQGVLDWDAYCGKFEKSGQPLDRGRQTSLGGMLQQNRAIGIKVPLRTVAHAMGVDEDAVARLALLPEHAAFRDPDGAHVLSTGLHAFLGSVVALKGGDKELEARLPEPPLEGAEPAAPEAPAPEPEAPAPGDGTPAPEPDGGNSGGGDAGNAAQDAPVPYTEPAPADVPAGTPAQDPPAPAPAKAPPKQEPKPRRPKAPRTKYSVGKADLDKMLRDVSGKPFDVRKTREFLMALPEYKPQDVALMLDDEAVKLFQDEYVSVSVMAGSMILSRRNYQALLDLLNGNAYVMREAQEQD